MTAFRLGVGSPAASAALSHALIGFRPWAVLSLLQQTHERFAFAAVILLASGAAAFWWFNRSCLSPVMGDSARLLSLRLEHLAARQAICTRRVDLTRALRECERHDRIIIVANCLGSLIGDTILRHCPGMVSPFPAQPGAPQERLQALEHAA